MDHKFYILCFAFHIFLTLFNRNNSMLCNLAPHQVQSTLVFRRDLFVMLQRNIFLNFFLGPLCGILRQAYIIQSLGSLIITSWAQNDPFIIEKDLFMILKPSRVFCRLVKMTQKQIREYPC